METNNNQFKYENKVYLTGRVGQEPKVNTFNGRVVANFSLATEESYKNRNGEQVVETTWHSINYRGSNKEDDLAPDAIHRGDAVSIRGKIRNRKYTSPDGTDRVFTEVVAFGVTRVAANTEKPAETFSNQDNGEGDLPF